MKTGIIYVVSNTINNKLYIGKTIKDLNSRKSGHHYDAFTIQKKCAFYNAVRKHGWDNFKWKLLYDNVPLDILNIAEICAIFTFDTYCNGYNSTIGGEISPSLCPKVAKKISQKKMGHKVSIEARKKISKSLKGFFKKNPHAKTNISKKRTGLKASEETKQKMSKVRIGKKFGPMSEETKQKLSKANKGRIAWNKGKKYTNKRKREMSITSGGKLFYVFKGESLIGKWVSQVECARELNLHSQLVNKCLHRHRKTHGGYTFRFVEDI